MLMHVVLPEALRGSRFKNLRRRAEKHSQRFCREAALKTVAATLHAEGEAPELMRRCALAILRICAGVVYEFPFAVAASDLNQRRLEQRAAVWFQQPSAECLSANRCMR